MKRIAANRVLLQSGTLLLNAVVEIDDAGVVRRIFELAHCTSEPASTLFYNGLITTFVPKEKRHVGTPVPDLVSDSLAVGYSNKLLLWQNVSLSSFKITVETKIIEI